MKRSADSEPKCIVCDQQKQQQEQQSKLQQKKPVKPPKQAEMIEKDSPASFKLIGDMADPPHLQPLAPATTKPAKDTAVNRLGDFMLKGWVMLNECCADCQVPLVRTRDRTLEQCVMCDYQRDLTGNTMKPVTTAANSASKDSFSPTLTAGQTENVASVAQQSTAVTPSAGTAHQQQLFSSGSGNYVEIMRELLNKMQVLTDRMQQAHELAEIQAVAECIASVAVAIQRIQELLLSSSSS